MSGAYLDEGLLAPDPPPAGLILDGACPFEGCAYGTWRVERDTQVFASPSVSSRKLATLETGRCVTTRTGEVHTTKPGRFVVRSPVRGFCGTLADGQVLHVYGYLGEGSYRAWVDGSWRDVPIGFAPDETLPNGQERNVCGLFEIKPKDVWWVMVELENGAQGWTWQPDNFSGSYSLEGEYYDASCQRRLIARDGPPPVDRRPRPARKDCLPPVPRRTAEAIHAPRLPAIAGGGSPTVKLFRFPGLKHTRLNMVPASQATFPLSVEYGKGIVPGSLNVRLNNQDISERFSAERGRESFEFPLKPGNNRIDFFAATVVDGSEQHAFESIYVYRTAGEAPVTGQAIAPSR